MAAQKPTQRLQPRKPVAAPPLSQRKDMYAPDWDDPNVQQARVANRTTMEHVIPRGNSGVTRKKSQ